MSMSYDQYIDVLRLSRSENIGPQTYKTLLQIYKTPSLALAKIPEISARGGKKLIVASKESIMQELDAVERYGGKIITIHDDSYPNALYNIDDAPITLTCKGNYSLLNSQQMIAIVGSRTASLNGCLFAECLAAELHEYTIVSGLALGIDTHAHKGSVTHGTIAVLAGGIDHIYPAQNTSLYHKIAEKGLLVAESIFGTAPISRSFPRRNRIISGMAKLVLVVEATLRSGSLITAKYAKAQGKILCAVPGSVHDTRSQGSNLLLKQGAVLVENSEDIKRAMTSSNFQEHNMQPTNDNPFSEPTMQELDKYRQILWQALSFAETSIEDIIYTYDIPIDVLHFLILELELAGKVQRVFGNKLQKITLNIQEEVNE